MQRRVYLVSFPIYNDLLVENIFRRFLPMQVSFEALAMGVTCDLECESCSQKSRVGLAVVKNRMIPWGFDFTRYRLVTDGQTDGRTEGRRRIYAT